MQTQTIRRRRKVRFDGLHKAIAYVRRAAGQGRQVLRGRLTAQGGWIELAN